MTARRLHLGPGGRLAPTPLLDDPRLRRVLDLLNRDGEETRIVGGAVRNALLGLPPGDIDLATTTLPEAVMAKARDERLRAIPTGIAHGTVTLLSGGLPLEVTTLREDVETDGRHAVVKFGRDFARDAARRDFTVNALSVGPDGMLHDTTEGVADLAAGRIRFIGDAATRIREDYLRILRFFRFHASYGIGPLDSEGLAAAVAEREGLDRLSRERVRVEMLKLLGASGATGVLDTLDDRGLLALILGGPGDVGRLRRLVATADRAPDPLLRLAALAVRHDGDVERLRDRLRLSNAERDRLLDALSALPAMRTEAPPDEAGLRGSLFAYGRNATIDALRLAEAHSDRDGDARAAWAAASRFATEAAVPFLPFSGRDLLDRGIRGPAVGEALARLRERYREAGFPEAKDVLDAMLDAEVPPPPR